MKNQTSPAQGGLSRWPASLLLLAGYFLAPLLYAQFDFGDAPDGSGAGYPVIPGQPSVTGNFPTLLASNGARHSIPGQEWLGALVPDVEADAKVVNLDPNDDALPPIPFFLTLVSLPPQATVTFKVSVAAGAPAANRYVNMLIDWDQSGSWCNPGSPYEHVIQNMVAPVQPGESKWITATIPWGLGAQLAPQIFWMRITLTRDQTVPIGWDGTGSFTYGETEDFLFHPNKKHSDPGVPPPGQPVPGMAGGPRIKCVPKYQVVSHGTPATINVLLDNPGDPPPDRAKWKTWEPVESNKLDFGTSWPPYPDPQTTTSSPGPGGGPLLGTITAHSAVDGPFRLEIRNYKATAYWDGWTRSTCKAVVDIWHSDPLSPWGVFGIYSHYKILGDDLASTPTQPPEYVNVLLLKWQAAFDSWKFGDYTLARDALGDLRDGIDETHVPEPADRARLHGRIDELDERMPPNHADPQPVPEWAHPECGDTVHGGVTCEAHSLSAGITRADFHAKAQGDELWRSIGTDWDGMDGWSVPWNTHEYPDGHARLRVTMTNFFGQEGTHEVSVWIDNSAPMPMPELPMPGATVAGIVDVRAAAAPPEDLDEATCTFSVAVPDGEWMDIGADADPEDGYSTRLDTGQLWPGLWAVRARVVDDRGNTRESMWPIHVAPSFTAWRKGYGLLLEGLPGYGAEDDLDQDGIPLGLEYYFGLNPFEPEAIADHVHWEQMAGSDFRLHFQPAPLTDGVRCRVETSTDLDLWDTLMEVPAEGPVDVIIPTEPRRFIHLNLTEERP